MKYFWHFIVGVAIFLATVVVTSAGKLYVDKRHNSAVSQICLVRKDIRYFMMSMDIIPPDDLEQPCVQIN